MELKNGNKKIKEIYKVFGDVGSEYIKPTKSNGVESNNSLCFASNKDKCDLLCEIFEPMYINEFRQKFDLAVHGEGAEIQRITTLHSSSLCALLFFYKVGKEELRLNVNGKTFIAKQVYFEWENKVISKNSSVDVVLFGECDNKKAILFLESKFSEYTHPGLSHPSYSYFENYRRFYNKETFKKIGLNFCETPIYNNDKKTFTIGKYNRQYAAGLKQMASHYIGVDNLFSFNKVMKSSQQKYFDEYRDADIYLGSIVFAFEKNELKKYFDKYKKFYSNFSKHLELLKNKTNKKEINVIQNLLTYQEVFKSYNVDEQVKKFYSL